MARTVTQAATETLPSLCPRPAALYLHRALLTFVKVRRTAFRQTMAGMFERLRDPGHRPGEIGRFVRFWLAALAASAVIAISMIDYSIAAVGVWRSVAVNFALFGIAIVLLLLIARRRSNVARWLLAVPFNLLILVYDLAHLDEEMARGPLVFVVVARLGLMALATWQLFAPGAAAWFSGRSVEEE